MNMMFRGNKDPGWSPIYTLIMINDIKIDRNFRPTPTINHVPRKYNIVHSTKTARLKLRSDVEITKGTLTLTSQLYGVVCEFFGENEPLNIEIALKYALQFTYITSRIVASDVCPAISMDDNAVFTMTRIARLRSRILIFPVFICCNGAIDPFICAFLVTVIQSDPKIRIYVCGILIHEYDSATLNAKSIPKYY